MTNPTPNSPPTLPFQIGGDTDSQETREWMDALSAVIETEGPEPAQTSPSPAVFKAGFYLFLGPSPGVPGEGLEGHCLRKINRFWPGCGPDPGGLYIVRFHVGFK